MMISTMDINIKSERLYAYLEEDWNQLYDVTSPDLEEIKENVIKMFDKAYQNYMLNACPMDDLKPIECIGKNSLGGMAVTLLDTLDTLILLNKTESIKEALIIINDIIHFDLDTEINVFEVNIRALGGLISAHVLLKKNDHPYFKYDGILLKKAEELANNLLPAFDTYSGIPMNYINLKKNINFEESMKIDRRNGHTCCACAGTFLLEFGMLSHLTGNAIYEYKAKQALKALYDARSSLGLFGNVININSKNWYRKDSGIGAGIDSIYEYLLKSYLLFGDDEYLDMFINVYESVIFHMKTPLLSTGFQWIVDVHLEEGYVARPWISALSAFWPGLQALIGQYEDGKNLHKNYTKIWSMYGGMPEMFAIDGSRRHPKENGYLLRPEHIESTYFLYAHELDPYFLQLTRVLKKSLDSSATKCGYATIHDVATGELEDRMESFFLSETLKYLYLLSSNDTSLINAFVFSTEAHLFSPIAHENDNKLEMIEEIEDDKCHNICSKLKQDTIMNTINSIKSKFPLLTVTMIDVEILIKRRCHICRKLNERMDSIYFRNSLQQAQVMGIEWAIQKYKVYDVEDKKYAKSTVEIECQLQMNNDGTYECASIKPIKFTYLSEYEYIPENHIIMSMIRTKNTIYNGKLLLITNNILKEYNVKIFSYTTTGSLKSPSYYTCNSLIFENIIPYYSELFEENNVWYGGFFSKKKINEPKLNVLNKTLGCEDILIYSDISYIGALTECIYFDKNLSIKDSIVIIRDKGECSLTQAILLFQNLGAKSVIFFDSNASLDKKLILDDGVFKNPLVPGAFINENNEIKEDIKSLLLSNNVVHGVIAVSDNSLIQCPYNKLKTYKYDDENNLVSVVENEYSIELEVLVPKSTQNYIKKNLKRKDQDYYNVNRIAQDVMADGHVLSELIKIDNSRRQLNFANN